MPTIAKLVNFAILVGALVYFLKTPVGTYLRTRSETVRRELVDAAALRSEAERQLSDVRSQLAALPAELESLRRHGEEELVHERARMKAATEKTREQLLERTRRDIDFQFRQARRQLVEHTADVAMKLARRRARTDDHARRSGAPDRSVRCRGAVMSARTIARAVCRRAVRCHAQGRHGRTRGTRSGGDRRR